MQKKYLAIGMAACFLFPLFKTAQSMHLSAETASLNKDTAQMQTEAKKKKQTVKTITKKASVILEQGKEDVDALGTAQTQILAGNSKGYYTTAKYSNSDSYDSRHLLCDSIVDKNMQKHPITAKGSIQSLDENGDDQLDAMISYYYQGKIIAVSILSYDYSSRKFSRAQTFSTLYGRRNSMGRGPITKKILNEGNRP